MDYCSTCRRHLNGALVCPGCGAYAPDIAPGVVGGHRVPGRAATASGTAGAAHGAAEEGPAEGGWFTAPARSAETTRPHEAARPAGSGRPLDGARSSDTTWPVGTGRPGGTTRPNEAARTVDARPADAGRPLDGARSSDTTWPVGTGRPAETTRPDDGLRHDGSGRPAGTTGPDEVARPTGSAGATRPFDGARAGGTGPRPSGTARSAEATSSAEGIRSLVPAHRAESAVFAAPARPAGTPQGGETGPADDTPRALPAGPGTGRAARRRQLARWRKTQRRALVATAVALVGGGITLASTDRGGTDRAQAATASDLHGMGGTGSTTDEAAGAPSAAPDRTTPPPRADARRGPTRPEAAPTATAPPYGAHTDGAAATEVPAGGRSDASESVSRSGYRSGTSSGASQDTGGGAPSSGGSTTPTRPSSPPPSADDGSGSGDTGGDGGSGQGDDSATQPAPSTPPPADEPRDPRLCLLVICLG
ncbi:SCO2400 family protein [Streptomyces werraensis]|uniref:SCO2400 family protein n=1 Tax=Streptomyces werraensis TaxID=68284 RepID=UPI0036F61196